MQVYLAGAIGDVGYVEATTWRNNAEDYLRKHDIKCFNPMSGKEILSSLSSTLATQTQFGSEECAIRDLSHIDKSDLVLAELFRPEITYVGTLKEIFYSWEHRKPVVAWTGDNKLHLKSWNNHEITKAFPELEDCLDYIVNYWNY